MKNIKESIYEEIIHGQWWDVKSFSDKFGQSNTDQSIKFLEGIQRANEDSELGKLISYLPGT